jgi:hypothetical protein
MKDRAQQVVLAIATFDGEGRLLVSQSGLMPCQTITKQYHQRTFDDEFNTAHPVFQWIFRVSRNWIGISDLIPSMREHLQSTGYLHAPTLGSNSRASTADSEDDSCYAATFRELFCVTAHEIAKTLDMSLQNLGCLYEDVLTTGTIMNRAIWTGNYGNKTIIAADVATKDLEAGLVNPILFGKGQMMVLTRRVNTAEAHRLQNLGYGFASIDQVSDQLARSLQIPRDDLENLVGRLQAFSERQFSIPKRGSYIASFLVQPKPGMGGMDVIVPRATPDRLPMVRLSNDELDSRQLTILSAFNGLSLDECLLLVKQQTVTPSEDTLFLEKFRNRIIELLLNCPEQALHTASFSAQPLDMMHGMLAQAESSTATVFAFCGIKEIYVQSLQSLTLKTIPLSFFQTYLRSQAGIADHAILAQKNHKEFSSLQRVPSIAKMPQSSRGSKWSRALRSKQSTSTDESWQADTCSEKGLVTITQSLTEPTTHHPWGGIMVTSTQDIHIGETKDGATMEMYDLGVKSQVGIAETEQQTLADRLMSITTAFRDPHATRPGPRDLYHGVRK